MSSVFMNDYDLVDLLQEECVVWWIRFLSRFILRFLSTLFADLYLYLQSRRNNVFKKHLWIMKTFSFQTPILKVG